MLYYLVVAATANGACTTSPSSGGGTNGGGSPASGPTRSILLDLSALRANRSAQVRAPTRVLLRGPTKSTVRVLLAWGTGEPVASFVPAS